MEYTKKNKTILLLDDEDYMVQMLETTMELKGYDVFSSTEVLKAIEIFRENSEKIDLIITDQKMPIMLGIDFAKEIKKIDKNVPIIIYSGYSDDIKEKTIKELNLIIIKKPIIKKLIKIVGEILDNK